MNQDPRDGKRRERATTLLPHPGSACSTSLSIGNWGSAGFDSGAHRPNCRQCCKDKDQRNVARASLNCSCLDQSFWSKSIRATTTCATDSADVLRL